MLSNICRQIDKVFNYHQLNFVNGIISTRIYNPSFGWRAMKIFGIDYICNKSYLELPIFYLGIEYSTIITIYALGSATQKTKSHLINQTDSSDIWQTVWSYWRLYSRKLLGTKHSKS